MTGAGARGRAAQRARDERYMREALRLAALGERSVSPNPMVGAVLVRNGRIVSRGYHREFGGPHAEVECLRRYSGNPAGCTLYVNLEPCSHFGKTPPCTDRIIAAGIREVVIGMQDPNPLVSGRGQRTLRKAGVTVRTGVLRNEARELNERFITGITLRRPYVHLKLAQSLDGFISDAPGRETRITGPRARAVVHAWRSRSDAVLVGAGTIRSDNPDLTVRLVQGRDPDVVVVDGHLSAPVNARVFRSARRRRVFVVTAGGTSAKRKQLEARGVRVVVLPARRDRIPMATILRELYRLEIGSLLVEGGADIAGQLLGRDLVDRLSVFVAPVVFGKGVRGFVLNRILPINKRSRLHVDRVGSDVLLSYM